MKGSPIISTIVACLIMLGIYLCMHTFLRPQQQIADSKIPAAPQNHHSREAEILYFIEIQSSTPPSSILITHPITGEVILKISDLTETEWTGEILLPLLEEGSQIELNVNAQWQDTPEDTQNFIHIVLSTPDDSDTSSVLRSPGNIDTTATFTF